MFNLRGIGKKGDEKYYIIISIILGLIVLFLVLYFIFQEYFTSNELNWETCRQSIVMRNSMPEKDLTVTTLSGKGLFPLKCKTQVLNINDKDKVKAEQTVADAIAQCWYLVGQGQYKLFPSSTWTTRTGVFTSKAPAACFVCARIHIDQSVQTSYSKSSTGDNRINIMGALNLKMSADPKTSAWDYLNPSTGPIAFNYFNNWVDGGFSTNYGSNLRPGYTYIPDSAKGFNLPEYFDGSRGDLLVIYAESSDSKVVKPYFILINANDIGSLNDVWFNSGINAEYHVCDSVETVPA